MFQSLTGAGADRAALVDVAGAAVLVMAVTAALGVAFLKAWGQPVRAFLPSIFLANNGNMGLPLTLFAFGQEGMALGMAFMVASAVVGLPALASLSSGVSSLGALARLPMVYAVLLALVFLALDWPVPGWAANTLDLLAGFTVPLMLITLGASLAKMGATGMGRGVVLAALRLSLGFAVGWGVAEALGFEGVARGVVILQSSMPVAVIDHLYAQRYGTEPRAVAGAVLASTLASLVTLPILIWFVL
ncbi:MAG: AEC family transporter [Alphaproteobacteria bacterium]|nr:AEC family transporter [Alphaproteobacteria bacterium]